MRTLMKVFGVALLVLAGPSLWAADKPASVTWLTDLDKAIEQAQEAGKLLLIDNGWPGEGT